MIVGLQSGFGSLLGPALTADLRALGFGMLRLDCQQVVSADVFRGLVREVQDAGMTPLCIVSPENILAIPNDCSGLDLEVINEADLRGMSPASYLSAVLTVYEHVEGRHRIWAGGVSNTTASKLRWLRSVVVALPSDVGVTLHRYPKNGEGPAAPQDGFRARADEFRAIRSLVGQRPWGCSEHGHHTGPQSKGWWLWRRTWRWTDGQVADFGRQEMKLWRDAGASFAVWYQLNDGVGADPLDRFGIRRLDGSWKPVAHTLTAQ
jgi:hypothetical protein